MIKIGNAQGFWGDRQDAPAKMLSQQPDLDYLTLEYLAEVSMGILAIQMQKDPKMGYAKDFVDTIESFTSTKCKIITNAGGLNPRGCAEACLKKIKNKKIAIVSGDSVLKQVQKDPKSFPNTEINGFDTPNFIAANAYFGAQGIVEALDKGADIVITGRVADPSLTVGPAQHHFGWSDYNKIAGATIAGHLIECGTQVTGGISTNWQDIPNPEDLGYPFVEMDSEGHFVITKPKGTGGRVTLETVKEQLLYEIGDPAKYLSPDATVSFLSLSLEEVEQDRVQITGASGKAPPDTYKVGAIYDAGYSCEGTLAIFGHDAKTKARLAGEMVRKRIKSAGFSLEESRVECIGSDQECYLRMAVTSSDKEALEAFSKEIAPLVTSGPQGITGYTTGRPKVRQRFGFWPTTISKNAIQPVVEIV